MKTLLVPTRFFNKPFTILIRNSREVSIVLANNEEQHEVIMI